jgi:hypothetical protein
MCVASRVCAARITREWIHDADVKVRGDGQFELECDDGLEWKVRAEANMTVD